MLWIPSRTYNQDSNSVGRAYDAWSSEGILEHYWGEHIHLGFYREEERNPFDLLPPFKGFIRAKYDFIDEMLKYSCFGSPTTPIRVLDVGCGIGGTSRYLSKKFGSTTNAHVTGITLSTVQAERARELAQQQSIDNVDFKVMDALNMSYANNTFDLVWACESGEHMPNKQQYVQEMVRVLKPGGRLVIATWCQRDASFEPFSAHEQRMLHFLYSEWTHPQFIAIRDYVQLMHDTQQLVHIESANWTPQTIPSWLHSIWVGVLDPWPVMRRPRLWWKTFRECVTLMRMHKAFRSGLMEYGMMTATKSNGSTNDNQ
jgi:MPBQ/MSBQ methyltransferase